MSGWIIVQWVIVRVGNCFTRYIIWPRYSQEPLWFLAHIVLPYSLVHLFYNKTVKGIKAKVMCIIYLDLFVQLIQPHSFVDYSCPLIYSIHGHTVFSDLWVTSTDPDQSTQLHPDIFFCDEHVQAVCMYIISIIICRLLL